jgi:hypothetical protein
VAISVRSNLQSFLLLGCEGTSAPALEAVAMMMRSTHPIVHIATNSGKQAFELQRCHSMTMRREAAEEGELVPLEPSYC